MQQLFKYIPINDGDNLIPEELSYIITQKRVPIIRLSEKTVPKFLTRLRLDRSLYVNRSLIKSGIYNFCEFYHSPRVDVLWESQANKGYGYCVELIVDDSILQSMWEKIETRYADDTGPQSFLERFTTKPRDERAEREVLYYAKNQYQPDIPVEVVKVYVGNRVTCEEFEGIKKEIHALDPRIEVKK